MLLVKAVSLSLGLLALALILPIWGRAGSSPAQNRTLVIGFRSKWTRASPEAWVAGHAAAYPVMTAASVTAGILGAFTLLLALLVGRTWGLGPALFTGGIGYVAVFSLIGVALWRSIVAARAVAPGAVPRG